MKAVQKINLYSFLVTIVCVAIVSLYFLIYSLTGFSLDSNILERFYAFIIFNIGVFIVTLLFTDKTLI